MTLLLIWCRFKNRELQIMRRLDHCNIVSLLYFFYTSGEKKVGHSLHHSPVIFSPVCSFSGRNLFEPCFGIYPWNCLQSCEAIQQAEADNSCHLYKAVHVSTVQVDIVSREKAFYINLHITDRLPTFTLTESVIVTSNLKTCCWILKAGFSNFVILARPNIWSVGSPMSPTFVPATTGGQL